MAQRPTPHSIALAALISLHCEEDSSLQADSSAVDAFLQNLVQRPNDTVQDLVDALVPTTVSADFHRWLQIAAHSMDAFFDLMGTVQQSILTGAVDAYSANGLLLRSVCEGLDELEFHEMAHLYQSFKDQVMNSGKNGKHELAREQQDDLLRNECWSMNNTTATVVLSDDATDLPSAQMLRFQQCLENGERVDAVHALHQYMVQQQESEDILPFCSIVLAAMHHPTEPELMQQATEEAVRVAQQSQDASCVAFALGWLSKASNENQNWMERCVARASEANLSTLAAGANLSLSLQALQSSNPSESWAYWSRASSDSPTEESGTYQPTRLTESAEECRHILARQKMVAAGIFETFGSSDLSRVASISAIQCHRKDISNADAQIVVQNLARTAMFGSGAWKSTNVNRGQLVESMLENDLSSSDLPCIYGNALETIISLRSVYEISLPARNYIADVGLIALEWSIMRGEILHAESLLNSLQGQIYTANDTMIDLEQQRCLLLARKGRWGDAIQCLKVLVSKTEPTKQAKLLLQIAIHTIDSSSRGFADALKPLEECLRLSQQHAMNGLHSSALAVLAKIHLLMGDASRAIYLLRSIMASLLQSAHIWLQSDAYLTMAQALLKLGKLKAALNALGQSEQLFRLCDDTRQLSLVFYLKARIYNAQGNIQERDLAAEKFTMLSRYMEEGRSVTTRTNDVLGMLATTQGIEILAKRPFPVELKQ